MSLLEKMKVSSDSLTLGEKLAGSLQVTMFGILVVFFALGILYVCINIMHRVLNPKTKKLQQTPTSIKVEAPQVIEEEEVADETELVAVITAAIAATLQTSSHNIIVRNITRLPESTPAWGKLGRMENVNRW